jgi:DNA-binding CsgD family transcriptional regulator/tetratricopeptide (TPR) repeat protein
VANEALVLIGACDPLSTPRAHGPLRDISSGLGEEIVRLLSSDAGNAELFPAVLDRFRALRGAVIVFEDVHWADEASLDLLRYLGRRIQSASVLMIVTYRTHEPEASPALRRFLGDLTTAQPGERLPLQPLSKSAVQKLVGPREISAEAIHARTGGNPFFVTELLDAGSAMPPTVSDSVLGRWSHLSADSRTAVQIAAVIGPDIDIELAGLIAGRDVTAAFDEAVRAGLLTVHEDGAQFRHELAREAVLASITPLLRRQVHRQVLLAAQAHRPNADPAWLAHHATGAGVDVSIRTYSVLAAERAAALGSHREAVLHYQHALAAAEGEPLETRLPLLERYAQATTATGWVAEHVLVCNELIPINRSLGNRRKETEQLYSLANSYVLAGQNDKGEEAIQQALEALEHLEEGHLHAEVFAARAFIRMLDRDNDDAIEWGHRALKLAERYGNAWAMARAQNAIGSALIVSGNLEDGVKILEDAIGYARSAGITGYAANIRNNIGSASGEIFELATAEAALQLSIEEARAEDLDGPLSYSISWLALVYMYSGRWTEATRTAQSVLNMAHAYPVSRMMALLALGRVRVRRGDPQAWDALDEASELAMPTGTLQRVGPVAAARAEARWLDGDRAGTIEEAMAGYDLAVRHGHRWHAGELSYWLRQAGADADPPIELAEPWKLHRSGEFSAAAASWERRGCPYEAARVRLDCGQIDTLRSALRVFDSLGAAPMVSHTTQRLRELGAQSIPRGPRRSTRANPAGLTPREMDVLEQLPAGATYAEIANTLYVSSRTVEHHVSSILYKLDASSRRDAVRIAIDLGIISG